MPPDSLVRGPFLQHQSQQRIFQPVPSHASLSEQLGQATQEQGQEKALTQEAKIQAGRPAANTKTAPRTPPDKPPDKPSALGEAAGSYRAWRPEVGNLSWGSERPSIVRPRQTSIYPCCLRCIPQRTGLRQDPSKGLRGAH